MMVNSVMTSFGPERIVRLDFASTRKSGTMLAAIEESRAILTHILERLGRSSLTL
jgi:hypothetical protein